MRRLFSLPALDSSKHSFCSDRFTIFEKSSRCTVNLVGRRQTNFSKAPCESETSTKATCEGSIALDRIPSASTSNDASSAIDCNTLVTALQSLEDSAKI